MRKVVSLLHVSLDGFAASNEGMGLEWTFRGMNDEISNFANTLLSDVDTAMYGRQTYQGMQGYWSTVPNNPASTPHEREHARWIEQIHKLVFSTTLESADWNNSRLIKDHLAAEVKALKQQPGGTMMIFGSPKLVHSFIQHGLIDEYRLFLHPIVIGAGTPVFSDIKVNLNLVESKTFGNGVVYLRYQPA